MCHGRGYAATQEGPGKPGSSNDCPIFHEHVLGASCIPVMELGRQTAFEMGQPGSGERSQTTKAHTVECVGKRGLDPGGVGREAVNTIKIHYTQRIYS